VSELLLCTLLLLFEACFFRLLFIHCIVGLGICLPIAYLLTYKLFSLSACLSIEVKRKEILSIVNSGIHRLFETQIQSLREYYGRRYETILSEIEEENNKHFHSEDDEDVLKRRREKQNGIMTDAAKQSTEGFRVGAENAIPFILKEGELKYLGANYTFEPALDGLIRDMMHATSSSQLMEDEWASVNSLSDGDDDDTSGGETKKRRRGPIKWYEKLAARALVLSVNYLQGWLAYQGLRKAAAERDKMMPKFPMF
jgi:hypothetical protein